MAVVAGGAGDAQRFRADTAAQGDKAGEIGAAVVGLAGREGQRLGVDGDAIAAAGDGEDGQRVVGRGSRTVSQVDRVDELARRGHILVAGGCAGVVECLAAHAGGDRDSAGQAGVAVVGLGGGEADGFGVDGDGVTAAGGGQRWQGVVGRGSRAVGQGDGVNKLVRRDYILVVGRGSRVGQGFAAHSGGDCHNAGQAGVAVVGFAGRKGDGLDVDGHGIHASAVAVGRQAVVACYPAAGAVGERDGADVFVGAGDMAVVAGGAGDAQRFRADKAAQRHEAGQAGAAVVGLAGSQRQCFLLDSQIRRHIGDVVVAVRRVGDRALLNLVGHAARAASVTGSAGQAAAQTFAAQQADARACRAGGVGVGQGRVGVAIGFALAVRRYCYRAAGNAHRVVVGGEGDGVVGGFAAGAQRNVVGTHVFTGLPGKRAAHRGQRIVLRHCRQAAAGHRYRQRRIVFAIHLGGGAGRQGDRALIDGEVGPGKADGIVTVGHRALRNGVGAARYGLACAARQAAGKGVGARAPASAACGFHRIGECVGIAIGLAYSIGRDGDGALGDG